MILIVTQRLKNTTLWRIVGYFKGMSYFVENKRTVNKDVLNNKSTD